MNDIVGAVRDWLAAQASVVALVADRVYVNRVPRGTVEAADTFHPEKMLVVRQAGGPGKGDTIEVDSPIITILAYGESDYEADRVRRAVWALFRPLSRVTQGNVLIYDVTPTGGAVPLVDPDIVWPGVAQNFSVMAST